MAWAGETLARVFLKKTLGSREGFQDADGREEREKGREVARERVTRPEWRDLQHQLRLCRRPESRGAVRV